MKYTFAFLFGLVGAFGQLHPAVSALMILVVLDVISGLLKAFVTKTVSSGASWRGMTKKAYLFIIVAVAWVMTHKLGMNVGGVDLDSAVAMFYCVTQIVSIVENADALGVPIPKELIKFFENRKEK